MIVASLIPSASTDQATIEAALIAAGLALVGGIVGYFLKYYLDKKQAFSSDNAKIKRDMYQKYVEQILATSRQFKAQLTSQQIEKIQKEFEKHANDFYSTSILFASPKVVRAHASFMRNEGIAQSNEYAYELMLKNARLYKAMRKDIGLSNWGLGWDGEVLLRANINDYDTTIRPYTTWRQRIARRLKIKRP